MTVFRYLFWLAFACLMAYSIANSEPRKSPGVMEFAPGKPMFIK